ncbi:MAG: sigma factor-like helix-turn-helix DNA-binding protein [Streptosporangiaceae bacterium]
MSDTDGPIREPERATACLAASTLRDAYYRPLVRLAALLTGDAATAEAVACAALAALRAGPPLAPEPTADELRYLQRQVVARSRRSRRGGTAPLRSRRVRSDTQPPATTGAVSPAGPSRPGTADFARLPVVRALQELPRRGREAVVLTHYLDLSEEQAARVAGVTPAVLRRLLSQATHMLDNRLPRP